MQKHTRRIAVFLCLLICLLPLCTVNAAAPGADCVSFTQSGSNVYHDAVPTFYMTIKNNDNTAVTADIFYTIYNGDGVRIRAEHIPCFMISKKSTVTKSYTPSIALKYDVYTIKAKLLCGGRSYSYEDRFAISVKANKLSNDIGVGYPREDLTRIDDVNRLLKNAGFGWSRIGCNWDTVEKTKGIYEVPPEFDEKINNLCRSDVKLIFILGLGNPLYEDHALPSTDEGIAAFAAYCRFIAEHFKGRISTFEVWNEPNVQGFAYRNDCSGAMYAKLVIAASEAVKSAQPNAIILAGAFNSMLKDQVVAEHDTKAVEFCRDMLAYPGTAEHIDAVSFHPYHNDGKYSDESTFSSDLENVKKIFASAGVLDMPIWFTEFGSSSWYDEDQGSHSYWYGYTVEEQAANLVRMGVMVKSEPQIEKMIYYTFSNYEIGSKISAKEKQFGMVTYDGHAKKAYLSVSYMNKALSGANFADKLTGGSLTAYRFRGADNVFVIWSASSSSNMLQIAYDCAEGAEPYVTHSSNTAVIHVSADSDVQIHDLYGNETDERSIGGDPVYVSFNRKADYDAAMTVSSDSGMMTVNGTGFKSCGSVTLAVQTDDGLAFADQQTADFNGRYKFTFACENGKQYRIYVFNGNKLLGSNHAVARLGADGAEYDIDSKYYINGAAVFPNKLSELKTGDTIRIVTELTPKNLQTDTVRLAAYCVFYAQDGALAEAVCSTSEKKDGTVILTTDATVKENTGNMEFYLWTDDCTPLMKSVNINIK